MIELSPSLRHRPSRGLLPFVVVIAALLSAVDTAAQEGDTVWYVEWERSLRSHGGTIYPLEPLKVWFDETRAREAVSLERYVIVNGDSVHIVDTDNAHYESGLLTSTDMGWLTNLELIWQMRRTPSVVFRDEEGSERIASYDTRPMSVDFRLTKDMRPMRLQLSVSDEVPISRDALRKLGAIRSFIDTEISLDFREIYDTLATRSLLPFSITLLSRLRGDTAAVPVHRLKSVQRMTVAKDFFHPPAAYTGITFGSPSDAMLWELRAIPMPGGTKRAE